MVSIDPTWKEKPDDGKIWFVRIRYYPKDVACDFALKRVDIDKAVAQRWGYKLGDLTPFTGLRIEGEKK